MTKYGFVIEREDFERNLHRLINQLWKLIPMREHEEDWQMQLETVILELAGLKVMLYHNEKFIVLLSKLEGLRVSEVEFKLYRKTVFEAMSLLKEMS